MPHYDANQWLEFECDGNAPTAELREWAEKFSTRASAIATQVVRAEHGPLALATFDADIFAWKAYASIVGAGVGLWEKTGETGLSPADEEKLDKVVRKDKTLKTLAEKIDLGCNDLREKKGLGAGERSAHDFPGDDAALEHAASKLGATHFLIPLKREYDVAYYVYSPVRTGYFERRVIYKKRGLYHFAKTSDFVALPKDAVPMKQGTSYGETHAGETDPRQLYGPKTPRMQPGYAFYSPKRRLDWARIDNDDWEHVVVDEDEIGQMEYVGSRTIDGSMHDIFKRVFAPRSVGFYAQLQHMTRGGQADEAPRGGSLSGESGSSIEFEFPSPGAAHFFFAQFTGRAKITHRIVKVFDDFEEARSLARLHGGTEIQGNPHGGGPLRSKEGILDVFGPKKPQYEIWAKYPDGNVEFQRGTPVKAEAVDWLADYRSGARLSGSKIQYWIQKEGAREVDEAPQGGEPLRAEARPSPLWHARRADIVVVTRHKALVKYLIEEGLIDKDSKVIEHATVEDVRGKHVIGVLPLSLASYAASVLEVPLDIPAELRGKELTLAQVRKYAKHPQRFQCSPASSTLDWSVDAPQGGGPLAAAEGHKGEVVYMGDLSRPDADRIANGLRREEQKLRKLGGRGNYMDVRVEFQYERPSGNRFQVIVVPIQENPRGAASEGAWCVTWINPTTRKRQIYFDELPERTAEIEARTLRMHHPDADVRAERCHSPRVGEPLPLSAREGAREGDDAVPWVRITRDPKLYEEGIRRAKEIGPIDSGRQIYELLSPALAVENQEVFLVVLCNLRQECIGVAEVHRGERSRVAVSRADILQVVTKSGADHFHVVHNHPSGDPTPSEADRKLTEAIQDGAAEVEIPCVDHVVIGMGKFYSFAEGKVTKVR